MTPAKVIRFHCRKTSGADAGKVYVLEQVTVTTSTVAADIKKQQTLQGPMQAEALLDIYRKTRGRLYPDYEVNYNIIEPIPTIIGVGRCPVGDASTYTSPSAFADALLGTTVSAKMEFVPKNSSRREFPYSRLILQQYYPEMNKREIDTDGYWDPNPNYTTCFCFDFVITNMFRKHTNGKHTDTNVASSEVYITETYNNVPGILHIRDSSTLSTAEIASKGFDLINQSLFSGLYYSDDIEWRPQESTVTT